MTKVQQPVQDPDQTSPDYMNVLLSKSQLSYYTTKEPGKELIKNVAGGHFPRLEALNKTPGLLIYNTEVHVCCLSIVYNYVLFCVLMHYFN